MTCIITCNFRKANPEHATANIDHLREKHPRFKLFHGDLLDSGVISIKLHEIAAMFAGRLRQLEVYNLAALSQVKVSFECPEYCLLANGLGTLKILEAVRSLAPHVREKTRFYQASTSELYGSVLEKPQSEMTPFNPVSPYAASKLYAYAIVKDYRSAYGIYACNGILFNHESPRRGMDFVTRKITSGLGKILRNESMCIELGNIDSIRDWGHARDYVNAMWLMLQHNQADDYVVSTGETHSVREFIEKAFGMRGLYLKWQGSGLEEVAVDQHGRTLIRINERFFRPNEVDYLEGDSSKIQRILNWRPTCTFNDLVTEMVDRDA